MKELIDKLWDAVTKSSSNVSVPIQGSTLPIGGKVLIMDFGENDLTFDLPGVLGIKDPVLCEVSVDHEFEKITNKDLAKRIYLRSTDGTPIYCNNGVSNKVYLPMVMTYKFFYIPGTGWRAADALMEKIEA